MTSPEGMEKGYVVLPIDRYDKMKSDLKTLNEKSRDYDTNVAMLVQLYELGDKPDTLTCDPDQLVQAIVTLFPDQMNERLEKLKKSEAYKKASAARQANKAKKKQEQGGK